MMKEDTLKKTLVYSAIAVILGLLITLVPLIVYTQFTEESKYDGAQFSNSLPEQLRKLESPSTNLNVPNSTSDLQILAISFLIAVVMYVLVKRRRPQRDYIDTKYSY